MQKPMLGEKELSNLRKNAVFCDMDAAFISRALEGAAVRRFKAGEALMRAGDAPRAYGVLVKGEADVLKRADVMGNPLFMSILGEGDSFGAATMFHEKAFALTEVYTRHGCTAVLFSEAWFETLLKEHHAFARSYIGYLTGRVRFLNGRIESMACSTAAEKLLSYLAQNAQNGMVRLPRGMQKLADALSLSRASLYRVMDELEGQNRLKREGKIIYLK